ncbi:alpha/beta hydrolase, partial [Mycobacterium sp. CBMA361]|nr:alpha/beta hydrolase [Mycolicibacterium sp. CBMA 361]
MSDGERTLHSVRDVTPRLEYRTIHGYRRAFRIAGS